jgi:hypothetical protein
MPHKKSYNITEPLYNKIITIAYGDGSWREKIHVYYIILVDKSARTLFLSIKKTIKEIHKLRIDEFPGELLKSVERKTVPLRTTRVSFVNDFLSIIMARPVVSLATTLILITTIISTLFINRGTPQTYSTYDIDRADRQARYALTIVNKIFTQTNSTLKEDILTDRVSQPINNGVSIINNLFNGEKK